MPNNIYTYWMGPSMISITIQTELLLSAEAKLFLRRRYSWKMFWYQPLLLLLSFSNIYTAILSSSNEANPLQAKYFFVVLFAHAFTKDVNGWGLGTAHSLCLRHQRQIFFFRIQVRPKMTIIGPWWRSTWRLLAILRIVRGLLNNHNQEELSLNV